MYRIVERGIHWYVCRSLKFLGDPEVVPPGHYGVFCIVYALGPKRTLITRVRTFVKVHESFEFT